MNDNLPTADQIILDVMRHCGFRRNYQVAAYFNVTPQTLSGWIKSGVIPPRHLVKYNNEILKANSKENTPALQMDKSNPSYQGNDNVSPQRFSLATVKFTFVKHLRTLIVIPILSVFCALVYLFIIAEPVYTSVSKILPISEDGTNANGLTGMAAEFGISIPLSMGGKIPWDEIFFVSMLRKVIVDTKSMLPREDFDLAVFIFDVLTIFVFSIFGSSLTGYNFMI